MSIPFGEEIQADQENTQEPVNYGTDQTLTGGWSAPGKMLPTKSVQAIPMGEEIIPDAVKTPENKEGFFANLKTPWDLWKNESAPMRLKSAYDKGVFDKPIGELIQGAKDEIASLSPTQIWEAAKKDPGKFGAEFINSVVADPYLLFAPLGLGGKIVQNVERFGKAAKVAGTAAETGIMAGAISAPISAAQQLDEKGFIDPHKLAQDMGLNAATGAAIGGILGLAGHTKTGKIEPGNTPTDIMATAKFNMQEGDDIMTAMNKAMETHEVPTEKATALTDALKTAVKDNPDLEADFAKMSKAIQPLLPDEPIVTSTGSTKTFAQMTKDLVAERNAGAKSEADFAAMRDALQSTEAARLANETAAQQTTARAALEQIDALPNPEKTKLTQGVLLGSAEAAAQKPAFARTADDLLALKNVENMGAKEFKGIELTDAWKQRGVLSPELAKYMALGMGGAVLGGWYADDKAKGAVLGAALALGGPIALKASQRMVGDLKARLSDPVEEMFGKSSKDWEASKAAWDKQIEAKTPKEGTKTPNSDIQEFHSGGEPLLRAAKTYYESLKRNKAITEHMDDILTRHEGTIAGTGLAAERLGAAIKKLVPNEVRRSELIHAIQEGRVPELQGNERTAAELFQREMAEAGDFAQKAGILDDIIDDGSYVTQLWKDGPKAKNYYSSVSPTSRFAEDRLIPSYKKGIELGLEPKTLDLAEIARIYGKSIGKSIANKQLLSEIKGGKLPNGEALLAKQGEAPFDYVQLDHPQLRDLRVHPEIAPSLSHVFYSNNVPAYVQAMTAVSSVAKRGIFSFSGFHSKSLLDVGSGLVAGFANPKILTRLPSMYKMIKEGKAGDMADQWVRAGIEIQPHTGIDMDNNIFQNIINTVEASLKSVPGVGPAAALPITTVKKLDKALQWFLWEYLHPSIKLSTASVVYEKALLDQSALLNKNPGAKVKSPETLQKEIAHVTNDLFGGLNWRTVSDEVENKFLHGIVNSLTNPAGLRAARIVLLAPDWTVATARTGYKGMKAIAKSLIPRAKLSVAEDMYRRYFLGSALLYATVADGLNRHFTGKHFWENEDPTYVDLGDGRKLQLSKHFMEPFHWLQHPGKSAINKMGYVPKEALNQLAGTEYFSPYTDDRGRVIMGPEMEGIQDKGFIKQIIPRAKHALKGMTPITSQQPDAETAAFGFAGLSIYGKTDAARKAEKRAKERDPEQIRKKREKERRAARQRKRDY